jgi:hypothetical protein
MFWKIVLLVAMVAVGYWYLSPTYVDGKGGADLKLDENARTMQKCMRREESLNATTGMAGVGGVAGDAEKMCAEKHSFYSHDGQWLNLDPTEDEY